MSNEASAQDNVIVHFLRRPKMMPHALQAMILLAIGLGLAYVYLLAKLTLASTMFAMALVALAVLIVAVARHFMRMPPLGLKTVWERLRGYRGWHLGVLFIGFAYVAVRMVTGSII